MNLLEMPSHLCRRTLAVAFLIALPGSHLASAEPTSPQRDWQQVSTEVDRLLAKSRRLGGQTAAAEARAALDPWWKKTDLPEKIRLQRATLLQRDHKFDDALRDLDAILKQNPKSTEAWLMKATILTVMGRYEDARKASVPLFGLADPVIAIVTGTTATSRMGELEKSYDLLAKAMADHRAATEPAIMAWAQTALAEMATRLGRTDAADDHYRAAHSIDPASPYLLNSFGHFLIDSSQPQDALRIIEPFPDHLHLVRLRAKVAMKESTDHLKKEIAKYNSQTHKHGHSHGEGGHSHHHSREGAIFHLDVLLDKKEALHQARANWKTQREPADLLILARAAAAADDEKTIELIGRWITETGYQDVRLKEILPTPSRNKQ